jgi:hypothetical protein
MEFISKLPSIFKEDYLNFRKDYCITKFKTIYEIARTLYGTNDYQFPLRQNSNLELYFKSGHNSEGKISIEYDVKMIDIPFTFDLLQSKVQTKVGLINTQENYKSVYVHVKDGKQIIMNLPYYSDFTTPRLIFSYLNLIEAFASEYLEFHNTDINYMNQFVICPVNILSFLDCYCKQLQYIEQNCVQNQY